MEVQNFFIFVFGVFFTGLTILALSIQIKKQSKTTSADVSLKMVERMRDKDIRDSIKFLETGNLPSADWDMDHELRVLMDHFEDMAMFEEEGVLDIQHILQMHGYVLRLIKSNSETQKIIQHWADQDPLFYYIFLRRLLKLV
jgi:hypothetical protein